MSVLEIIQNRRSIRAYLDKEIPRESLDALIEAIRWAPSAGNLQSRKFYFVFNDGIKKKLAEAAGNTDLVSRVKRIVKKVLNMNFVSKAPLVVVACIDRRIADTYGARGSELYAIQDAAASIMNMMLAAHELGLGSVWVGAFNEDRIAQVMDLPDNLRPVALIPLGYPAVIPAPPARMSREDVVIIIKELKCER